MFLYYKSESYPEKLPESLFHFLPCLRCCRFKIGSISVQHLLCFFFLPSSSNALTLFPIPAVLRELSVRNAIHCLLTCLWCCPTLPVPICWLYGISTVQYFRYTRDDRNERILSAFLSNRNKPVFSGSVPDFLH